MIKVILINCTPNIERTLAIAARVCYSNDSIEEIQKEFNEDLKGLEKARKLIKDIKKSNHLSILEHSIFTFGVEGISRTCSHQLVRHRIASYSQRSQRYIKELNSNYVIPKTISENKDLLDEYNKGIQESFKIYKDLIDQGIPKEDARFLLPNATETQLVFTMNARELLSFLTLRGCFRAQEEIRELAFIIFKIVKSLAPSVFENAGPNCLRGSCSEGKFSCNRQKEVKEIWSLKNV